MWEGEAEGEEVANDRGGERPGELLGGGLDDLIRIRSKLLSLRDAVRTGAGALRLPCEGVEGGLELEDLLQPAGYQLQRRRRTVEASEPAETRFSWTIHSQDGCGIGEVTRAVEAFFYPIFRSSQEFGQALQSFEPLRRSSAPRLPSFCCRSAIATFLLFEWWKDCVVFLYRVRSCLETGVFGVGTRR